MNIDVINQIYFKQKEFVGTRPRHFYKYCVQKAIMIN